MNIICLDHGSRSRRSLENYDSFFLNYSEAEKEMQKLSQLAGKLNTKLNNGEANTNVDNVDLDQLFNFLSGEVPDSVQSGSIRSESVAGSSESPEKTSILDEIDRQMSDLQNEMDQFSVQDDTIASDTPPPPPEEPRESSPPPLPPPMISGTPPTSASQMQLGKPSLPEPEGPPPPPPIQNGYAFNTPHLSQEVRNPLKKVLNNQNSSKPKEPIYESIKPRPEPVGSESTSEYRPPSVNSKPPPVPPSNGHANSSDYGMATKSPRRRMASNTSKTSASPSTTPVNPPVDPEREARRQQRVKRGLERIQETNNAAAEVEEANGDHEDPFANLIEFAENYFNDHEKSPQGTIVGTLKRSKTMEMLSKSDMLSYYKGSSIPNSHIHLFDPENVGIACTIFKDLCKYSRGETKTEPAEVAAIQGIIRHGLEREELRDEIYVQCVRQLTNNPHPEQVDRIWLLLCLIVVAFPPSKSFFKVYNIIK